MEALANHYKTQFSDKHFITSLILSFLLLGVSLAVNSYAALYVNDISSNAVSDIVLSNTPVFDVDILFVYGPIIFWAIIAIACVQDPKKIPFMIKSIAVFVLIRSLFISLTHLGPYPDRVIVDSMKIGLVSLFSRSGNSFLFSSGGDLFFSAHTGLPFLMALVFWRDTYTRIFCLCSAIFFAIIVLLGHLHYSIDVMAAFFITYSIFHISEKLFIADRRRFLGTKI